MRKAPNEVTGRASEQQCEMPEKVRSAGSSRFSLAGRVAVVTGGAGRLGEASAVALAGYGVCDAILDQDGDAAAKVAAKIGGTARAYRCDISDAAQVEQSIARIRAQSRFSKTTLPRISGIAATSPSRASPRKPGGTR